MVTNVPFLSVVLSFFNEEEVLPELIARLRRVLRDEVAAGHLSRYELVFVDDASTDGSRDILEAEADREGDVVIVAMSNNFGVSPCVIAGMEQAEGDLVVYMDADLQDPPELIHEMLRVWRAEGNVDVVNTVRLSRAGEHPMKLALTRLGYSILNKVSQIDFIENAGDFKLLSRRVVDHMVAMREKLPFVRGMVYWVGYRQVTIPYHREARAGGETKFHVAGYKVIHNFLFSALIAFSAAPLMLTVLLGLATSAVAFLIVLYVFIQWLVLDHVTSGWTTLMAVIALLGGMQLLTNGINGLYINTIFNEVKRRPLYIVDHVYGRKETKSKARRRAEVE
jgi:dolichol-phosphate mannosyltransferase